MLFNPVRGCRTVRLFTSFQPLSIKLNYSNKPYYHRQASYPDQLPLNVRNLDSLPDVVAFHQLQELASPFRGDHDVDRESIKTRLSPEVVNIALLVVQPENRVERVPGFRLHFKHLVPENFK